MLGNPYLFKKIWNCFYFFSVYFKFFLFFHIASYVESIPNSENLTDLIEKFKRENSVLMQKTQEIREKINCNKTNIEFIIYS